MRKFYVEFFSPGTLFAENRLMEIGSHDIAEAVRMADSIIERHGATPYAFDFVTRERGENDMDSREAYRSQRHFLGGRILTLADVKREMPNESILIGNMERNGYDRVVVNKNSWEVTNPFRDGDVLLGYTPPSKRRKEVGDGEA